jgi:hypothetical protein
MMRYDDNCLTAYCNENNINLTNTYSNVKRDTKIEGICITGECGKPFMKSFRQLVKVGGFCIDCSKQIGIDKNINTYNQKHQTSLEQYCSEHNIHLHHNYQEKLIDRDTVITGKCKTKDCECDFEKPLRQLLKIGGYCAECSKDNGKVKIEATTLEKFGCKNVMHNDAIKQKICETNMIRYGVAHNSQSEIVKEKKKQTNLINHGVEYSLQSPVIRRKICDTNMQRYGAENPTQNKEIQRKIENTNMLRYGTGCVLNNEIIKENSRQTNLRKYGVEHHLQSPIVQRKISDTNIRKYGFEHCLQNPEYAEKQLKASYKRKQYTMPSGNVIDYQGYENFGFDRLLNEEQIDENDIITKRTEVPEIWYVDKNGKKRRHYVDMFVKSQNRCIEIKSTWTSKQENSNIYEKQAAGIQLGYIYEVWVFDANGHMIQKS